MGFSPQDVARGMVVQLRTAHSVADQLAVAAGTMEVLTVKSKVEQICAAMSAAHDALSTLQGAYDNATIASRIANHLEPSPADLPAAYTAARNAWIAMADDYGTNVLPGIGVAWTWDTSGRKHQNALYDIDNPANFRANIIALRDALAAFN